MSTTIDQRVVEMRFDNKHFEKNVTVTLSTLDKLKQSLKLTGASKGLENIGSTAGKVNLNVLSGAVENVQAKFSSLGVIGTTMLVRLSDAAYTAGQRIISSLSLDSVKAGLAEYETQINAIQTIMANVSRSGYNLDDVKGSLRELNTYADKTIYNFTEMTRNIGTFTAAGVDLHVATNNIKGIANAAAMAGANATQTATAMYQMSQAMASGTIRLQDWMSLENASMAGVALQDALMETARVHGIAIDKMVEEQGSFRYTLQEGWLTADLFSETLDKFTMSVDDMTEAEVKAARAKWKSIGYTEEQIDKIFELGKTATDAATKVKTFTQLIDVVKETAQSGWTQTWELIIGDFEEAKDLFTKLSDWIGGIQNESANKRNSLIKGAFGSSWDQLSEKIETAGGSMDEFKKSLKKVATEHDESLGEMIDDEEKLNEALADGKITKKMVVKALKDYVGGLTGATESTEEMTGKLEKFQKVVDEVWKGDFKNGEERIKALTDAGYDYAEVQELVNKTVDGHKLTLADLSDAQLKAVGCTDKQIEALKKLAKEAESADTPLSELLDRLNKPSGRILFLESLGNIIQAIVTPLKAVKAAWDETFDGLDSEELYNIIEKFEKFTESLIMTEDQAENFQKVCEGLLSVFKLMTAGISKGMTASFKLLQAVLKLFGMDLFDVIALMADYVNMAADWVEKNTLFLGYIDKMADVLYTVIVGIRDFIKEFLKLDSVSNAIKRFKQMIEDLFSGLDFKFDGSGFNGFIKIIETAFANAKKWIKTKDEAIQMGLDIIAGLTEGIRSGIGNVVSAIVDLASRVIQAFKDKMGIHSPSTVFMALGAFLIAGLVAGIIGANTDVFDAIKDIASKAIEAFKSIDWSAIFVAGSIIGLIFVATKLLGVMEKLATPIEGVGKVIDNFASGVEKLFDSFVDLNKAKILKVRADAIFTIAKAIALLAASFALLAYLVKTEGVNLLWSVGLIALLGVGLVGLMAASKKLKPVEVGKISWFLISISASLLLMSIAMKQIASIDYVNAGPALVAMAALIAGLGSIVWAFGKIDPAASRNIHKAGKLFTKMAIAIGLLALTIKLIASMSPGEIKKGIAVIAGIETLFGLTLLVFKAIGKDKGDVMRRAGGFLLKMSIAIGLLVIVIKMIASMPGEDIVKGIAFIAGVEILLGTMLALFNAIEANREDTMQRAGTMLLKMAIAIGLIAVSIKLIASLSGGEISKGLVVVAGVMTLFAILIAAFKVIGKKSGKNIDKAGEMLFKMAAAIGILAISIRLLAGISTEDILKGVATIGALELMFAGIIYISKFAGKNAEKAGKMLTKMATGILILTAAIAVLSILDTKDVIVATGAIATLIAAYALLIASTKNMPADGMKTLIALAATFAAIAVAIGVLSVLDTKKVLGSSAALSLTLGAFAVVLKTASGLKPFVAGAMKSILAITGVVAILAIILGLMAALNVEPSIETAASLSLLLLSMAATLKITSGIKMVSKPALTALYAISGIVFILAVILGIMSGLKVEPSIETAAGLSILLISMAIVTGILGAIGPTATMAVQGVLGMIAVTSLLGAFMILLGTVVKDTANLEQGIAVLDKIARGIGSFLGNIIDSFAVSAVSSLPEVGKSIHDFMENISIDPETAAGIESLSKAIMILTAASFVEGLTRFTSFGSSIADFGKSIPELGTGLRNFIDNIGTFTEDQVATVKNAGDAIVALAEAGSKIDGQAEWAKSLFGDDSLGAFSGDFATVGANLRSFIDSFAGVTEDQVATVKSACDIIKLLVQTGSSLNGQSEWARDVFGDNSLAAFATQLGPTASALSSFITNLGTLTEDQVASVRCACDAIKVLAEAGNSLNGQSEWGKAMFGDNSISTFADQLPATATALNSFVTNLGTFDDGKVATIKAACDAIKAFAEAGSNIDGQSEWGKALFGDNGLASFSSELPTMATNLATFVANLGEFGEGQIATVNSAVGVVQAMAKLGGVDLAGMITYLPLLGDNLTDFASDLVSFCEEVGSIENTNIDSIVSNIVSTIDGLDEEISKNSSSLKSAGEDLVTALADGIKGGEDSVSSAAKKLATSGSEAVTEKQSEFETAGEDLGDALVGGMESKDDAVSDAGTALGKSAASGASDCAGDFESAGGDFGSGLVRGINSQITAAYNAGFALGQAAVQGEKDGQQSHSPSKLTKKAGVWLGEGLIIGIDMMGKKVYNAGYNLGDYAAISMTDAVSKISDVINGDMDVQPTIRPVMDLSDVKSGASAINDMLNTNSRVGVMANVNAISSMANRNQNGGNFEVVSAINKLRKDLGNVGNTTYQVNGVTYDDGTNVANAVKALIREAKLDRRR